MRVAIVTYTFPPDIGGVATTEAVLASSFASAGHDVTVVTLAYGPTKGYGYRIIRNPSPRQLFALYRSADIVIVSNLALKLIYPLLSIKRQFALRHHSESAFRLSQSRFFGDRLRRAVLPRAKHFMTSAFIGRKSGLTDYVVTYPFANPEHIRPDICKPANARDNALFVGRVEPEKGILYLLDRWEYIRKKLGVATLRVVGSGSVSNEVERQIVQGRVQHVEYLGRLSLTETAREMGRSAYCLVPSLWEEPFGAVALEALAARSIVIHTDRGGLPETTGAFGFMFDPDSSESLDKALEGACRLREELVNSSDRAAWYTAGIEAHLRKFEPAAVVDEVISTMAHIRMCEWLR